MNINQSFTINLILLECIWILSLFIFKFISLYHLLLSILVIIGLNYLIYSIFEYLDLNIDFYLFEKYNAISNILRPVKSKRKYKKYKRLKDKNILDFLIDLKNRSLFRKPRRRKRKIFIQTKISFIDRIRKKYFKLLIFLEIILSLLFCIIVSEILFEIILVFDFIPLWQNIAIVYFATAFLLSIMFSKIFAYSYIFDYVGKYQLDFQALLGITSLTLGIHLILYFLITIPLYILRFFSYALDLYLLMLFISFLLKNIKIETSLSAYSFKHPDIKIY